MYTKGHLCYKDDTRKCKHLFLLWYLTKSHTNMAQIYIDYDQGDICNSKGDVTDPKSGVTHLNSMVLMLPLE